MPAFQPFGVLAAAETAEIVEHENIAPARGERVGEIAADKSASARHQNAVGGPSAGRPCR